MKNKADTALQKMDFMHSVLLDVKSKKKKLTDNWREFKLCINHLKELKNDPDSNMDEIKNIESAIEPMLNDFGEAQKKIAQYNAVQKYFNCEYYGDIFRDEDSLLSDILDVNRRLKDYFIYNPSELSRLTKNLINITTIKDDIYNAIQAYKPSDTPETQKGNIVSNPTLNIILQVEKHCDYLIDEMKWISGKIKELTEQQKATSIVLQKSLDKNEYEIIELFFKEGLNREKVGERTGKSGRHCDRLKDEAILKLIDDFKKCP